VALKYHQTSRGEIAYETRGWGDPLLMVHGVYVGASHDEFRRNIDALAKHFTIYAIDLLGFGDSDMPRTTYTAQFYQNLLRDFIVEVIGQPTHVMASGVSCGPAVSLAVYNDSLMRKLVLIEPIIDESQTDQPPPIAAKVQQFLLGTLSLGHGLYDTIASEFELKRFLYSRYAHPKHVTPQRVAELRERATRRHSLHGFISLMTGHLQMDVPRWLRSVRCEVLILWGEKAGPVPREPLTRPAAWSKGRTIEIIPDAGHWPHDEQSARVNQVVAEFLEKEPQLRAEPRT
jgi:pimeloyl-ACP methyl ester carboxylesterase